MSMSLNSMEEGGGTKGGGEGGTDRQTGEGEARPESGSHFGATLVTSTYRWTSDMVNLISNPEAKPVS